MKSGLCSLANTKCCLISFLLFFLGIGGTFYQETIFENVHFISLKSYINNNSAKLFQTDLMKNKSFKVLSYAYPRWYIRKITMDRCEFRNCVSSYNKQEIAESHLVLFHHSNLNFHPPVKYTDQIWGLMSWESPYHSHRTFMRNEWNNKFDWTISYQQISEGYGPYGKIVRRNHTKKKNYDKIFNRKSKSIAWIVSNCRTPSRRMEYVKRMKNIIDIDIFGKCGKPCPMTKIDCLKNISSVYKFYLSFENSLCIDYATEKIFKTFAENINIVPVVRGAPNVKSLLPNNTFISTIDYQTPEDLAIALKSIGNNRSVYLEILKRKDKFIKTNEDMVSAAFCSICKQLNTNRGKTSDIKKTMSSTRCLKPSDLS